jgi:hypothetical protein
MSSPTFDATLLAAAQRAELVWCTDTPRITTPTRPVGLADTCAGINQLP